MPDHWHAVIGILPGDGLSKRMAVIGNWISRKTRATLARHGVNWQDGYHDTRLRSGKQFGYVINYVRTNPVRAGLVETPDQWPYGDCGGPWADALTRQWSWRFEHDEE